MAELLSKLAEQPATFWFSVAALVLSTVSITHSIRATRFTRRIVGGEKKTDTLQTLTEARFTASHIRVYLYSLRPIMIQRNPVALPELDRWIAETETLERRLEAKIATVRAMPSDVLSIEEHLQSARIDLASVKKVVDGLAVLERSLGSKGVPGGEH